MGTIDDRIAPLALAVTTLEERLGRARAEPDDDRDAAAAHCREMQQAVVRFGAQAGAAGASGLAHAAEWLSANLEYLAQKQRSLLPEEQAYLQRWPQLASDYVAGPSPVPAAARRLVHFAEHPVWTLRPSPVGSANILTRLTAYQSPERNVEAAAAALASEVIAHAASEQTQVPVAPPIEVAPEPIEITTAPQDPLDFALAALADAAGELAAVAPDRRDAVLELY
ncbi:MAG TPA: hypothetical protein VEN28_08750, partial [Burkholderiaceae bacterium]|nr:hypothetical protein [Burkholderiaceae bacterium]